MPRKSKSTMNITPDVDTRAQLQDNARIASLLKIPGMTVSNVVFDPSRLSVKIRNRAIKYMEMGYVTQNGWAASVAMKLNDYYKMELVRAWSSCVPIPKGLTPDQIERAKDILTADYTAHVLTQKNATNNWMARDPKYRQQHMEHLKLNYEAALRNISASTGHTATTSLHDLVFLEKMCVIFNESTSEEVLRRRESVIDKLTKKEIIQVVV